MRPTKKVLTSIHALRLSLIAALWGLYLPAATTAPVDTVSASGDRYQAIIGGGIAELSPWVVALVFDADQGAVSQRQFCGAVVIDPLWVLTAAHCVFERDPDTFSLASGSGDLDDDDIELLDIERVVNHPFYAGRVNDLALLRLKKPTEISPIKILDAAKDEAAEDVIGTVYGWGRTDDTEQLCEIDFDDSSVDEKLFKCVTFDLNARLRERQAQLLRVDLSILSQQACANAVSSVLEGIAEPIQINSALALVALDSVLCVKDQEETSTTCFGDSGGPLIANIEGEVFLVGIVSGSLTLTGCDPAQSVAVFTRASYFEGYIDDVMGRNPALDFGSLCPQAPELSVRYSPTETDNILVTLDWTEQGGETGYLVHYSEYPELSDTIDVVELPSNQSEISIEFIPEQKVYLAVQAFNANCNSGLSNLISVVPEL